MLALLAFLASLLSGGYLATAESWGMSSGQSVSIDASGSTVVSTWTGQRERNMDNEPVTKFWAAILVGLSLAALTAAMYRFVLVVWLVAVLLTVLSVLGLLSIGILVAPVALLLLMAAVCLTLGRPRGDASMRAEP